MLFPARHLPCAQSSGIINKECLTVEHCTLDIPSKITLSGANLKNKWNLPKFPNCFPIINLVKICIIPATSRPLKDFDHMEIFQFYSRISARSYDV